MGIFKNNFFYLLRVRFFGKFLLAFKGQLG